MIDKKNNKNIYYLSRQLDVIFENSSDPLFVTNSNGELLAVNHAGEIALGCKKENIIGKNVKQLIDEGYYDNSSVINVLRTKKKSTVLLKTKIGFESISTSIPIFDEENKEKLLYIVTNGRNIMQLMQLKKELNETKEMTEKYYSELQYLRQQHLNSDDVICESKQMKKVIELAKKISDSDAAVLLLGDSGVGKEVLAKYIHKASSRNNRPFIAVNCAAIPESLFESEFFGYEGGAFTGAKSKGKKGFFELADQGTLFMDEVGELLPSFQTKLLRVLETSEITRVGGSESKKIDVRIIAATNRNLQDMLKDSSFRLDLYYRLNTLPIYIPPLRERPEDIVALALYFLDEFNKKYNWKKCFSKESITTMKNYHWPGNVRELRNVVERFTIMVSGNIIEFNEIEVNSTLKEVFSRQASNYHIENEINETNEIIPLKILKENMEKKAILNALKICESNKTLAAQKLGIQRSVLYRMLEKYKFI